jgi:hypothetical protein
MTEVKFDFIIYAGDPDDGAEAVAGSAVAEHPEAYRSQLPEALSDVYGAVVVERNGKRLTNLVPDPLVNLVTRFVKAIPFVIDGEAETILWSESEHGFAMEPQGEEVLISMFKGDAYEPEAFLLEPEPIKRLEFSEQVLSMGDRLKAVLKALRPETLEDESTGRPLVEFLEAARPAVRSYRLARERGIRTD